MTYLATIAAFGFPQFNPPTLLPIYQRIGARTCQFYRNIENPPQPTEARKLVESLGMSFDSVHGVFGPEHDPSSPDEPTRRKTIETYRREADLAVTLGGKAVVVHPAPPAKQGEAVTEASRRGLYGPLTRSFEDLAEIGRRQGVCFLIENLPGNYRFGSDPLELAQLIRRFDSPHIRMCVDLGHAHMTGYASSVVDECADVIGYLHVHDNDGKADSHQIPGEGTIPWPTVQRQLARLPQNTPAMLELFFTEQELEQRIDQGLAEKLRHWLSLSL